MVRGAFLFTFTEPKAHMATADVLIFDTTLRDGEQAPGNSLSPEEKLRLARQLDALGVDILEAGFPAASEGDYRSVREIAAEVRRPVIAALARCHDRDIDLAGEAIGPAERGRLHVFISTSDLHIREKLRITRDDVLALVRSSVRRARSYTDDVEFSAEDASRTDPDFLCRVVEVAIAEGARTINLPGHRRLRAPERVCRDVPRRARAGAAERQRRAQRPLSRRPGPRGRQLAGGDRRGRRDRWSAPSTASASAPATRRSRRS